MKKVISLFVVCSLIFTLFIGCGQQGSQENSEKGVEQTTDSGVQKEQNVDSGLKGKIEFFQQKREVVEIWDSIIKEFKKEYPNVVIEQNTVPDSQKVLLTRMASDSTPDIFTTYPWAAEFTPQVKEGYIMDLTDKPYLENINQDILKRSSIDGKIYAVPMAISMMGIFYNVQVFEELGLEIPKTYDELIAVSKKIKSAGNTPLIFPDKDAWACAQFSDRISGILEEDGPALFEKIAKGQATSKDSKGFRKLAEIILELRGYGQEDSLGTGYGQAVAGFANGEAAMIFQGIWARVPILKANPNLEFSMFPFPAINEQDTALGINIDTALSVSAKGGNVEIVDKFLEFVTRKDIAQMYADQEGSPSVVKGVKSNTEEFSHMIKFIESGKTYRTPSTLWAPGMYEEMRKLTQDLIVHKNVDKFLEDLDTTIIEIYNNR